MSLGKITSKKKTLIIVCLALIPAAAGIYVFNKNNKSKSTDVKSVSRQDIDKSLFLNGKVQPLQSFSVLPVKSGTIQKIFVKEGDNIKAGAELYSVKLEISGEQELIEKKARVKQLQLEVEEKEKRFNAKSPVKDLLAKETLIKEELELNSLKIQLKVASDAVKIGEQEMGIQSKVEGRSNIIKVLSPIDGIVTLVDKKPGEFISAGQSFSTNNVEKAVVVADLSKMLVQAKVTESDLRYIDKGMKVNVSVDAYSELKLEGTISRIGGQGKVDNASNSTFFEIEATINNAPSKILPEMTAYLEVLIASRKNVIAVPADSIVVLQNHGYVHIPDSNESKGYKELKVVTGINNAQYVEVIDGLKEQDKVMTIDLAKVDVSTLGKDDKSKKAKQ